MFDRMLDSFSNGTESQGSKKKYLVHQDSRHSYRTIGADIDMALDTTWSMADRRAVGRLGRHGSQ